MNDPHDNAAADRRILIQYMLKTLERPVKPLTAWELGFLASISDARSTLSNKQLDQLRTIYEEKTA